jgi:RNA polymerase sigma-70 factor (ECF subfamily)
VQEAFIRLYECLAAGQVVHDAYNWVVTVAKNLAVDQGRRWREVAAFEEEAALWSETLPDDTATAEEVLLELERNNEFQRLLSTLTGIQKQCVILRANGVPFYQIGAQLGMSTMGVVYQTNLALKKLQNRAQPSLAQKPSCRQQGRLATPSSAHLALKA